MVFSSMLSGTTEQYKSVLTFMSVRNICQSQSRYRPVKAEAFKTLLKYDNHTQYLAKY